jgi:phage shock protein A
VDQELRAYLEGMEARAAERETRLETRLEEMEARVDDRMDRLESENRQTRVLLEGMHDSIRLLAEGVMGNTERLEEHQAATAQGFQEVKEMLSPYYRDLNGRAQRLENDVQFLDRRLKILEAKSDRQTEDVLESIRKKFGRPQA